MKILYDHQIFYWQKYGGISRYFYELISRIVKYNTCKVDVYQGFNNNGYNLSKYRTDFDKYFSAKPAQLPKTGRIYQMFNKCGLQLFTAGEKYKIYHPTYYDYHINNSEFKVVTVYDMIHELYYKNVNDTTEKKRKLVDLADGIIAISHQTKADLVNVFNVPEEKIQVIYLANSLKYEVCEAAIYECPYILYVGNRDGYKNFSTVLKALAISGLKKDLFLICFGGGSLKQSEQEMINKFKLGNRVIQCTGNDHVLANLYKNAEAFIYPSEYEGFGIPPLEAMYYKTPVIVSNTSSIPEVVGNAGVYFNPLEYEELAEKLVAVCEDSHLRNALICKGVERERIFSWDTCARETVDYYKKVVENNEK